MAKQKGKCGAILSVTDPRNQLHEIFIALRSLRCFSSCHTATSIPRCWRLYSRFLDCKIHSHLFVLRGCAQSGSKKMKKYLELQIDPHSTRNRTKVRNKNGAGTYAF